MNRKLEVYWVSYLFYRGTFMCKDNSTLLFYIDKNCAPLKAFEAQSGEIIKLGDVEIEESILKAIIPKGSDESSLVIRLDVN